LPSEKDKDKDVTDRMIQVGRILHTPVFDHLIISMKTYLSFLDEGIMEELEEKRTKWEPSYVTQERIRRQAEEIGKKLGRLEGLEEGNRDGIDIGHYVNAHVFSPTPTRILHLRGY